MAQMDMEAAAYAAGDFRGRTVLRRDGGILKKSMTEE
jgi:hypothetical protein